MKDTYYDFLKAVTVYATHGGLSTRIVGLANNACGREAAGGS
jgi:hypothetical protein